MKKLMIFLLAMTTATLSELSQAYDEPEVNLGYTSFFDGGPPAGPGFYFQNYLQYYSANKLTNALGKKLPLPETKIDVLVDIIQGVYLSNIRFGNAGLAVSAVLPSVISVHTDDGIAHRALNGQNGVSDLFIGPALQFDPVMKNNHPLFVQRVELDVIVPVGYYKTNNTINPGNNAWGLNPYWASTYWFTEKWSSSVRLHYLWNAKNNRPNRSFGSEVNSVQAGQAIFGNFASEYAFKDWFHLGINGYFFNQVTDTQVNAHAERNRHEQIFAIGPGMVYGISNNQYLFANLYCEQFAKNRSQGTNAILRYVLHLA